MNTKSTRLFSTLSFVLLLTASFASKTFADFPPLVGLLATDPCAAEAGSDPAVFTVIRIGPTNAPLTVYYQTGGDATNGLDYEPLSGEVTIPAGAYSAPITVIPIDDDLVEGTEMVVVALYQPPVWPPPYIVTWPSVAVGHIEDNDF